MHVSTDFLVLGSGLAGLSFALRAAEHGTVAIVTKREPDVSNSAKAQGGIASVLDPSDSVDAHVSDTLTAGAGLCREDVVRQILTEGPDRVRELAEMGVDFSRNDSGDLDLTREGGHSARRIAHAKDATGREIIKTLLAKVEAHDNIQIYANHIAIDVVTTQKLARRRGKSADTNRCVGAYVLDETHGTVKTFTARMTILATGGGGKVYLYTSNPDTATGDGVAMAYRAGATVLNMEFFQFHPTCLFHPAAKSFLITEAMRGEGAKLRTLDGNRFMDRYHDLAELAPRDIVARAIDAELKRRGDESVLLDITHKDASWVQDRFPMIYKRCLEYGIDITTQPIPVVPATHYMCGGVRVDYYGETEVKDLFAIGEVTCTGLHGANRLASNSLLECAVYGHRASGRAIERLKESPGADPEIPEWDPGHAVPSDEAIVVSHNWDEVRRTMWNYVGIVRSNKRLQRARRRIDLLNDEIHEYYWAFTVTRDLIELRNIALVADLVVRAASSRHESRGLHYTIDYPEPSPDWVRDTILPA